jgi:hypothetical protein
VIFGFLVTGSAGDSANGGAAGLGLRQSGHVRVWEVDDVGPRQHWVRCSCSSIWRRCGSGLLRRSEVPAMTIAG